MMQAPLSILDEYTWEETSVACPLSWRVPTESELQDVLDLSSSDGSFWDLDTISSASKNLSTETKKLWCVRDF